MSVNWGKILAIATIVLALGASVGYALVKDYCRAVYWAAAAVLTASVTF